MSNVDENVCQCTSYQGIHTIIYEPGRCEAIVQCQECGKHWYSLLFERMNFTGGEDTLDEYQIPITLAEYQQIVATPYADLILAFLRGRSARVLHAYGVAEVTSGFALDRCGRS